MRSNRECHCGQCDVPGVFETATSFWAYFLGLVQHSRFLWFETNPLQKDSSFAAEKFSFECFQRLQQQPNTHAPHLDSSGGYLNNSNHSGSEGGVTWSWKKRYQRFIIVVAEGLPIFAKGTPSLTCTILKLWANFYEMLTKLGLELENHATLAFSTMVTFSILCALTPSCDGGCGGGVGNIENKRKNTTAKKLSCLRCNNDVHRRETSARRRYPWSTLVDSSLRCSRRLPARVYYSQRATLRVPGCSATAQTSHVLESALELTETDIIRNKLQLWKKVTTHLNQLSHERDFLTLLSFWVCEFELRQLTFILYKWGFCRVAHELRTRNTLPPDLQCFVFKASQGQSSYDRGQVVRCQRNATLFSVA